jgi:UDP-N-acetylglucosamine acyltransferase
MISNKAIIDSSAELDSTVSVEPFAVIGPNVQIGAGSWIGSHSIINGPTTIGENNSIYPFASIGLDCQDKKYAGENTRLTIGNNNIFRESCTVHRGTVQDKEETIIGNDNLFMINAHVAHDCVIGNNVIFSNGASVAGHVIVEDNANLGGFVGVHQFCAIGKYSFAAGGSIIKKDVVPFALVHGHPAKAGGINVIGLQRHGFSAKHIEILRKSYNVIFNSSKTVKDAVEKLLVLAKDCAHVQSLIDFINHSSRGILR